MNFVMQLVDSISRLSRVKKFQLFLWLVTFFVMISMQQDIFLLGDRLPEDRYFKSMIGRTTRVGTPSSAILAPTMAPNKQPMGGPAMKQPSTVTAAINTPPTTITTISTPTTKPVSIGNMDPKWPVSSVTTSIRPPQTPISTLNYTIHSVPDIYNGKSLQDLPQAAQNFLKNHCDMHNVKEWYPKGDASWKQRAPYVILAGVWNAGVTSLQQALQQHPQINTVGLPDFFLPRTFYRYHPGGDAAAKVFAARERMYAQVYPKFNSIAPTTSTTSSGSSSSSIVVNDPATNGDASFMIAMDVSPGYLFYGTRTSTSIQCVSPWSKIVVLLRDPVDRVYRQWVYGRVNLGLRLNLEDWIAQELHAMQSAGLVRKTTTTTAGDILGHDLSHRRPLSKEEEQQAWKVYQSKRNPAGAIGRSMYVLQLEEWFETLRSVGKEPSKEMFLIRSEVWEKQPQEEYQQLLKFLGLAPTALSSFVPPTVPDPVHNEPMKPETKKLLHDFFEPYNQRLATLLQENGFNNDADWNKPLWS